MPIEVFTGTPGAGKTLRMLQEVQERAKREGRPVYYNGINGLSPSLGWIEFDVPEEWYKLPDGAIIVIDEGQRVFRPAHYAKDVPPHLAQLETHRHHGFDIYLTTQRIMLLHANLRGLIGRHVHVNRRFGTQHASLLEFPRAVENPQAKQEDAVRHEWRYPKEVFEWYKSAEVHTIKRRIPAKVWVLLGVPVLIAVCVYVFQSRMTARIKGEAVPGVTQAVVPGGVASNAPRGPTRAEYLVSHVPRVAGLAYTAPVYDKVTEPVRAPYPAACIRMGSECRCYTDQATVLEMTPALCMRIVQRGFYVEWDTATGRSGSRDVAHGDGPGQRTATVMSGAVPVPVDASRIR